MGIFFHAVVAFFIETDFFLFKSALNVLCTVLYTTHRCETLYFVLHFFAISFCCQLFSCSFFIFIIGKKEKRDTKEVYILTMYADHTIESSTKEDAQWAKIFYKEHCYFYMIFQKISHESFTRK